MKSIDERRGELLARRIPMADVVPGRAYIIHARNGGVGVAVTDGGQPGFRLRRVKFRDVFLFVEVDWDVGPPHGTAIPLRELEEAPPADDAALLAWLEGQELANRDEVRANWRVLLGSLADDLP